MSWTIQAQITIKSSNAATQSLVVADRSIYSVNSTTVFSNPGVITPPISGAGTRLMWFPSKSAFRAGTVSVTQWDAANIGPWSFATGYNTNASGDYSVAMGYNTIASGDNSTVMGYYAKATGDKSTAMGYYTDAIGNHSTAMGNATTANAESSTAMGAFTTASGNRSTAMGFGATASGLYSTAMGEYTTAQAYGSVVVGRYNVVGGSSTSWTTSDQLFVVGNGSSLSSPNNALVVLKNGNLVVGTTVFAANFVQSSDRRFKKNIKAIENPLSSILSIKGVRYDWRREEFLEKKFSDKNQIGFIAQDLEKIFPEMVFTDEKGYKSVDYARLTPVLVEAVKELATKNEVLKIKSEKMEARLEKLEALLLKTEVVKNK